MEKERRGLVRLISVLKTLILEKNNYNFDIPVLRLYFYNHNLR